MDEAGRPMQGSGQGSGERPHGLPVRNMADIARMFLDGARPHPPVRTPNSQVASPAKTASEPQPRRGHREQVVSRQPAEGLETAAFLALAAPRAQADQWNLLLETARGLADEQATSVAVVGVLSDGPRRTFVADVVGVESTEELPLIRAGSDVSPDGQGNPPAADMQIARALHRLKPAVGLWLIAAPDPEARAFPAIASIVRNWLLACATDNQGLVAGYQHLKRAWMRGASTAGAVSPGVYLLSHDYAHAAIVHKRLRKAALEFLRTDLPLAGAGPVRGGLNGGSGTEAIRVMTLSSEGPEDLLWAALLDELCPMNAAEEAPRALVPAAVPAVMPAASPAESLREEIAREEKRRAAARTATAGAGGQDVESVLEQVQTRAQEVAQRSSRASETVLDHLAQVLDPEERQALSLGFDDAPEETATGIAAASSRVMSPLREEPQVPPAIKTRGTPPQEKSPPPRREESAADRAFEEAVFGREFSQASQSPPPLPAAHAAEAGGVPGPITLRAFEIEDGADRRTQWQAVEKSIWDLSPHSALLDARPPMSWAAETCLSIDASGCLNVWTLYKDGASWFALREWAHEHRNLLALTRRDLTLRGDAEVAVHIIFPLEEESAAVEKGAKGAATPGVIAMMMKTPVPHVHLYQLRRVQWNNRRGLLVVPIA